MLLIHEIMTWYKRILKEKAIPGSVPSMVGKYHSFCALMKQQVLDILAVHCITRRHNLIEKQLGLPRSL